MRHYDEGVGVVVKRPYVTNTKFPFFYTAFDSVVEHMHSTVEDIAHRSIQEISYTMIQPRMANRYEAKVACFNGKAMYVAFRLRFGPSIGADSEVMPFAEFAINELQRNCRHAILDGLVRVDIFKNGSGKFVVNEFESLDADYNHAEEGDINILLEAYWLDKMNGYVEQLVLTRTTIS
jgi:hypothetical protein